MNLIRRLSITSALVMVNLSFLGCSTQSPHTPTTAASADKKQITIHVKGMTKQLGIT